jgi:autotransporter-associated beta strand protein
MSIVKIHHNTKVVGTLKVISSSSTAPLYTITRSGVTTTEGFTISYTINSLNVAEGTSVPYVVSGITPEDLSSGSLSGDLIIDNSGTATLSLTLEDDGIPEGIETITLYVGNASSSIDVDDTSYSDTYTLNRSTESTDEGTTVTYTLSSTIASIGSIVPYIITGISQEDLSSGSITGNFVLDSNKVGTVSLTIANDFLTEGTETITIVADGRVQTTTVNDTSVAPPYELILNADGENGSSNSRLIDTSIYQNSNNVGLNRSGTPTLAFDDLTNSPSVYFDGSGDYYRIVDEYAVPYKFTSSAGTFSTEAWIKLDDVVGAKVIMSNLNSSTTGWSLIVSGNKLYVRLRGYPYDINGTSTLLANVWYHVALCGSTGSYKLFLNGYQEGNTYTGPVRLDGGTLAIAAYYDGSSPFKGYMKGIRINNTALYTQNFSNNVPTTPLSAIDDSTLLLFNPSPSIVDSTGKNKRIITEGLAEINTSNFKNGTGSIYFNGVNSSIRIPANPELGFGLGNFTVEFWCNFSDINLVGGNSRYIISQLTDYTTNKKWRILIDSATTWGNAAGGISFWKNHTTGCKTVVSVADDVWHHIAFSRTNGVLRCFVDGVLKSTVNDNSEYIHTNQDFTIGRYGNSGFYKGWIDDLKITKQGIYTQNFTP